MTERLAGALMYLTNRYLWLLDAAESEAQAGHYDRAHTLQAQASEHLDYTAPMLGGSPWKQALVDAERARREARDRAAAKRKRRSQVRRGDR